MERRYRNISGIDGVKTVMTYNEAFPLWVAEVYRNHGYEPDTWYGSEVAEKMHKEALATYKGPPATMLDYVEAIPSEEEFEYLDYAIQQLRKDNINLNALPDKERWAVMDRIIAEYAEHKNALLDSLESSALTILMGDAGTAKTFLSLACGLEQTVGEDPKYRSMLVVRPNVKFDETVGFLKGSEAQKINPLIRPIMDNLDQLTAVNSEDYGTKQGKGGKKSKFATEEAEDKIVAPNSYAQYLFDSGKIEAQAMEYMRGRSIRDRYMIIDEAQNMTPLQAFGIISRAGVGTKIILTGDQNQVDNPLLDSKTNGLTYAANAMKGSKVCTQITFEESECERSELAKEAIKRMKIKGKGRESR